MSLSFGQLVRFSSCSCELEAPSTMCRTPRSETLGNGGMGIGIGSYEHVLMFNISFNQASGSVT